MNRAQDHRKPSRRTAMRGLVSAAAVLAVGLSAAFAHSGAIQGAGDGSLELVLLHGTKQATGAIPPGWPELSEPPFTAYNHYEIVGTKTLSLEKGKAFKEALPDGSTIEATLHEVAPKHKFELVVKDSKGAQVSKGSYSLPKGKRILPVSTPYKGGNLVVALKVL